MNKFIWLFAILLVVLTACTTPGSAPAPAPVEPTTVPPTAVPPTAQVIVVTVEVPAQPTEAEAPPTPIPTATLPPPPTEAPATEVPPTQEAPPPEPSGEIAVPASLNGTVFENITVSGDAFSLRCNPKTISFDLYSTDIYITQVDFYYRIRDKHSNYIPAWSLGGTLETDKGNHFWVTYSGESVKADNRKDQGWFDFQFVGMNKYGDVVGRSEHIKNLVSYTIDCP